MDIKEYLRIFRRYGWLVVLLTLIGTGLGYATTFSFVNKHLPSMFARDYQSTTTLFVATQNGTSVSEAYQNNLFSQERVVSYAGLATSEQVAARAVDQLKAPISAADLRKKISAKPQEKTVLLSVSVRDPDAAKAQTYANAVGDQLVRMVSELETSRLGGSPAAAAVVVDEANYPTKPMGLSLYMRLGLGAAAGLLLGILLAVLVGILDKRLRGREPVESVTDSLVLGGLPVDPARREADVVDLAADGLYAERVRELQANLRFTMSPNGSGAPRLIAITSPSHEEGRTTTAIDLAAAFAESGRSVCLVDGDLRGRALADRLPLNKPQRDGAAQRGVSTVLNGENQLVEGLIEASLGNESIALLPAGPAAPRPGQLWASDRAAVLFEELGKDFDYVIVDTPPLEAYTDGAIIGALCDGALVLARIRQTTTSALQRALRKCAAANVALIGTVVTFEPVGVLAARRRRKQVGRDAVADKAGGRANGGAGGEHPYGRREPATENLAAESDALIGSGTAQHSSRRARESR